MGRPAPARRSSAVNRDTGEIVQLEIFADDALRKSTVRYDWNPYSGRHVNVPKRLMQAIWHKDSGYTQNDRDLFGFYLAHSPEGTPEPLRLTFKEIAETLGVKQEAVSRSVDNLHRGGILLEAESFGRVKFYKLNPRAGYDGPAAEQVEATKDTRHPVVPAPEAPAKKTTTRRRRTAA